MKKINYISEELSSWLVLTVVLTIVVTEERVKSVINNYFCTYTRSIDVIKMQFN